MSQWNALNVNLIKTRRIECRKLNLPAALTKSPESFTKKSSPTLKFASKETENWYSSSQKSKQPLSKNHSSGDSLISPGHLSTENSFSSSVAEDEVFQESFETPPDKDSSFSKSSTRRCLSLPAYLSSDQECYYSTQFVCFRPRRLFEEALNLESSSETARRNGVNSRLDNQGSGGDIFPREQEKCDLKTKQSRTTHAERMKRNESSLITFDHKLDNNNNLNSDPNNLGSKTQSKSGFDVREWEKKVLVLTSDYEFGTESSKKPRKQSDSRSRSVALTGNISTIVSDKRIKNHNPERQVKSEGKSEMPKLQTAVWDYVRRKSTKRKRKNDTSHLENQENLKPEKQESSSENVENTDNGGRKALLSDVKSVEEDSAVKIGRNEIKTKSDISQSSRPMKRWKSTPNLRSNFDSEINQNIPLRRYSSFNFLCPTLNHKSPPKLPAKERQVTSESLTFLLTTATEEKPTHERMQTLKLSREWLLKELKSMREDDRMLARQFINLRSAIVKMRECCEKEELEYDSESEGLTQRTTDTETLHEENKRSRLQERKIQIHDTPTINILSYC